MRTNHPLRLASGLALAATLAFGSTAMAQDDMVGQVEQALHDDAVAAYDAAAGFLGDVEGAVTDATSGVLETVQADLGALEARLGGAVDMTGDAAAREYREIQHAMEDVASDIDGALHQAGHTLEDAERDVWQGLQDRIDSAGDSVDHVIDDLKGFAAGALGSAAAVEGTLHDGAVAAFESVKAHVTDIEGSLGDAASGAIDTAKADLEAIEGRLAGAIDTAGDGAAREYREIQHALHGVAGNVDDFLHDAGHTIENAEHDALNTLQDGVHDVAEAIDHVIDGIQLPF